MSSADNRVAVIGGGIAGLTTAILLQINGYRTFLYARKRPSHEPDIVREPEFASLHAAASVIPHSVSSPKAADWTATSQEYFNALSFRAVCGVRTQLHYEIFEGAPRPRPVYADAVKNFEMLDSAAIQGQWIPRRRGALGLSGWKFDVFFCEVPEYMRYLYSLYQDAGGRVVPPEEIPGDSLLPYLEMNYKYYINCAGVDAPALISRAVESDRFSKRFEDSSDWSESAISDLEPLIDPIRPMLIRGHYLRVDIKELMTGERGRFFSYNYVPEPKVYRRASGEPADIYCYPRSDAWILGGSRQEGRLTEVGEWEWEPTVGSMKTFERDEDGGRLAVPSPIFDLNSELLFDLTEGKVDLSRLYQEDHTVVSPGVGYRFVRDSPTDSVRLSVSRLSDASAEREARRFKYVFHNYGHGGSGFTLSWGCAVNILQLLDSITMHKPRTLVPPHRRKFVLGHASTVMMLADLTARLMAAKANDRG